jgi:hypothetical protein
MNVKSKLFAEYQVDLEDGASHISYQEWLEHKVLYWRGLAIIMHVGLAVMGVTLIFANALSMLGVVTVTAFILLGGITLTFLVALAAVRWVIRQGGFKG